MSFTNTRPPKPPRGCGNGGYSVDYCCDVINADTGQGYAADALRRLGKQFGTVMDPEKSFLVRQVQDEIPFDLALDCRGCREMAHKVIIYPQAYRLLDSLRDRTEKDGLTTITFSHPLDRPWMITHLRDFLYTRQYDDVMARLPQTSYHTAEALEPVKVVMSESDRDWEPGQLFLHLHMYLFAQRYGVESLSRHAIKQFHKRACLPRNLVQSRVAGSWYIEMLDLVYSNPHDEVMAGTLCHLVAGDVHMRENGLQQLGEPLKKHPGMWMEFLKHEHKMLQSVFKDRGDLCGSELTEFQREWHLNYLRKVSENIPMRPGPMGRDQDGPGSRSTSGPM